MKDYSKFITVKKFIIENYDFKTNPFVYDSVSHTLCYAKKLKSWHPLYTVLGEYLKNCYEKSKLHEKSSKTTFLFLKLVTWMRRKTDSTILDYNEAHCMSHGCLYNFTYSLSNRQGSFGVLLGPSPPFSKK